MRLFICALWSPAGKGLTSWLSFVVYNCEFVIIPLGKHRESEDVSPHKLGLLKIAFEVRLGFENIEIYTLLALWSVTLIFSLLWGSILVITRQSNLKYQGNYSLFHN